MARKGIFFETLAILFVNIMHNIGLFNSPAFTADEFTYVARGWAFMHLGLLEIPPDVANFQYPPLGYMLIGIFYFLIPSIVIYFELEYLSRSVFVQIHA